MWITRYARYHTPVVALILLVLALSACAPAPEEVSPPSLRITTPDAGALVNEGEQVTVCMEARGDEPVEGIDLLVNSLIVSREINPDPAGRTPVISCQRWQAREPGRHTLLAQARLKNGDTIRSMPQVVVVVARPTPTLPPALLTPAPTPTSVIATPIPLPLVPATETPTPMETVLETPQTPTSLPETPTPLPTEPVLPVVQILTPVSGHRALAGQVVEIRSALSSSRGIVRVELWADGSLVAAETKTMEPRGAATVSQYWSSKVPGEYQLVVRAFDKEGLWVNSQAIDVTVIPHDTPPQVWISEPKGLMVLGEGKGIDIKATALDAVGIVRLELWVGTSRYTYVTSTQPGGQSPFSATLRWYAGEPGPYELFVRAISASDNRSDSGRLAITVIDASPPALVFNVSPRSVVEGDTVRIDMLAMADYGLTMAELYIDDLLQEQKKSSSPEGDRELYASFSWTATIPGQRSISVMIHDVAGRATSTERLTVRVSRRPIVTPTPQPEETIQADIISPPAGFRHLRPGPALRVRFDVLSDKPLEQIELYYAYAGETPGLIKAENARGRTVFTAAWDWLPIKAGQVRLFVRAYDSAGRTLESIPTEGTIVTTP